MTLASLLIFIPVYALAVLSPGPGVASIVARTLSRGPRGAGAAILGFVAGDLTWLLAAVSGLALIAKAYAPLFRLIQYAGAAYLLYVAVQMWRAKPEALSAADTPAESGFSAFLSSYLLTLGNPKTMVFFVSIMPLVVTPEALSGVAVVQLALTCAIVLALIFSCYVALAARARRLFTSTKALARINRCTAGVMGCTALVVASR
ncbi:MAG: LysE family translocator [Proteobacteria bacterium]|nr:LysE family translocator [Pseudomonadota bacterium]